jgi:hypothetical protein
MEIEAITRMQDTNLLHYIDGLYGYAMVLTRNQAEAEDLCRRLTFALSGGRKVCGLEVM